MLDWHVESEFNTRMEYDAWNKNFDANESNVESSVRSLDEKLQAEGVLAAVNDLGSQVRHYSPIALETLGQLTKSAIIASHEVVDKRESVDAQEAFLRGAVTGLLVASELPGEDITAEQIMASLRSLCEKENDGRVDMAQVWQKGDDFFEQVSESTKDILKRWAATCDVSGDYNELYTVGFGLIMAGATSASAEREFLGHLESSYVWEEPTAERRAVALQSIDNDCGRLASAYQKYIHDANLANCSAEDMTKGLARVAAKVNHELGMMTELQIDDCLQTRGDGVCLAQDEDGLFSDFQPLNDTRMIRGKFLGIDILPVPTEYALITQEFGDESAFEPLPCLMLEDAESVGATDDVDAMSGIVAVPLQVNGLGMDRVIFQTGR